LVSGAVAEFFFDIIPDIRMPRPVVRITVVSDVACPWCYVGTRRMENALQEFPEARFEVTWHSYMIDPSTPEDGMEYLAYNEKRWGGDGWTHSMRAAARKDGIAFASWKTWPHTLQAHRLIQYGQAHAKGTETAQRVMRACYEEGRNVSDVAVLMDLGREIGLPEPEEYLRSDAGAAEVRDCCSESSVLPGPTFSPMCWVPSVGLATIRPRDMDVSGVPYFIIEGPASPLEGATSTATWTKVLRKVLAAAVTDGGPTDGPADNE